MSESYDFSDDPDEPVTAVETPQALAHAPRKPRSGEHEFTLPKASRTIGWALSFRGKR
jgi:hypothetical protein